jgi:hypothetical protein
MTAQIPDGVSYRNEGYSLTGVNGKGLFEPQAYGLDIIPAFFSACWRGYVADYAIVEKKLTLTELRVYHEGEDLTELLGVRPEHREHYFCYTGLEAPIEFTGGLLIGREFQEDRDVPVGFPEAWHYAKVHELLFEHGRLTEEHNRSAPLAQLRERGVATAPDPSDPQAVRAWIEERFSLRYGPVG